MSALGIARAPEAPRPRQGRFAEVTQRLLLEEYAPASVLVNPAGSILYFHGATLPYLDLPAGEPTQNVLTMAREGLGAKLRSALRRAARDRRPVRIRNARIRRNGDELLLQLVAGQSLVARLIGLCLRLFQRFRHRLVVLGTACRHR